MAVSVMTRLPRLLVPHGGLKYQQPFTDVQHSGLFRFQPDHSILVDPSTETGTLLNEPDTVYLILPKYTLLAVRWNFPVAYFAFDLVHKGQQSPDNAITNHTLALLYLLPISLAAFFNCCQPGAYTNLTCRLSPRPLQVVQPLK
jgi:hypothetical protein